MSLLQLYISGGELCICTVDGSFEGQRAVSHEKNDNFFFLQGDLQPLRQLYPKTKAQRIHPSLSQPDISKW